MADIQIDKAVLERIERDHPLGLSSSAILDILSGLGVRFSEATLRKWVQLGLLPRSVRVGRKGKHTGSQGMYPPSIVRQILRIREMMNHDLTIEQIQHEILFVRADIEELERGLQRVFLTLDDAARQVPSETIGYAIVQEIEAARRLADQLVQRLNEIEARLISRANLTAVKPAVG